MDQSKKLSAGILRNDRMMADGRTIRYYDTSGQSRSAKDLREAEEQPAIGELRLDPLVKDESFYLLRNFALCVQQLVNF